MKKALIAGVLMLCGGPLWAHQGDMGAGVILGNPIGATLKYFLTESQALDGGLGASGGDAAFYADYLWHGWDIFPQPKQGRLGGYLGLGGRVRSEDDLLFGLRTVAGADYWIQGHPIEVFAEIVPVFELTPGSFVQLDAGLGVRYYFSTASKGAKK